MHSFWPFFAGAIVAARFALATLPILVAAAIAMAVIRHHEADRTILSGTSRFHITDDGGRIESRLSNTLFTQINVPVAGEPRPRRLLLRQSITIGTDGDGRVRLDAWPMGAPVDLRRPPIYTIRTAAGSASLGEDSLFWTERDGRRSAWSLADGAWLFDADLPLATFSFEPEARRIVALSVADPEWWPRGAVAVFSYAAPGRVLRRVALFATDPMRGNALRATLSASRLVTFTEPPPGGRVVELSLAAGPVRIPVATGDLDLAHAHVPAGLRLIPLRPWGG